MNNSQSTINLPNLIKIYGYQSRHALRLFRSGKTKSDIFRSVMTFTKLLKLAIAFGSTPWQLL